MRGRWGGFVSIRVNCASDHVKPSPLSGPGNNPSPRHPDRSIAHLARRMTREPVGFNCRLNLAGATVQFVYANFDTVSPLGPAAAWRLPAGSVPHSETSRSLFGRQRVVWRVR